jgi:hypothetical protein
MADNSIKLLIHFMRHILIAAILFCAVAGVSIFLWYVTVRLEQAGVPDAIRVTLFWVSELLFWLDVGCLILYVLSEVIKWLRELWASFCES